MKKSDAIAEYKRCLSEFKGWQQYRNDALKLRAEQGLKPEFALNRMRYFRDRAYKIRNALGGKKRA